MLPKMTPMRLTQQAKPFHHPEWLFEVKFDGFRSLAYIDGQCELVSRKDITYKRFQKLREQMKLGHSAILDGEIVCVDSQGRSQFYDLMFNRGEAHFYAFDLLWLDGESGHLKSAASAFRNAASAFALLSVPHLALAVRRNCARLNLDTSRGFETNELVGE